MSRLTDSSDGLWVVFGAGPLGCGVMELAVAAGRKVRMVTRSGAGLHMPGVELRRADVSNKEEAIRAAEGASVIFHCANADYTKWPELLPPIYQGILAAAEAAGARMIAADNLYMYRRGANPMTEQTPVDPPSPKGELRAQMARLLLESKVEVAIARGSDFFGPRAVNAHLGRKNLEAILAGNTVWLIGNPDRLHSLTYVPDFCRALVTLAEAPSDAMGRAWLVPTAPATTTRAAVEHLAAIAGKRAKIQALPGWTVRVSGLFVPLMRALCDTLYQFEEDFVMDSSAFTKRFGIEATPFEQSFRESLDSVRV